MQLKVQEGVSIGMNQLQGDADTNLSSALLPYSHCPDSVNQTFSAAAVHANAFFGILSSSEYELVVTCSPSQKNLKCKQGS